MSKPTGMEPSKGDQPKPTRASTAARAATQTHLTSLIGAPQPLPVSDLPTKRNILQAMVQWRMTDQRDFRNIPVMEIAGAVCKQVKAQWLRVNHRMEKTIVTDKEIMRRMFMLWQKLETVVADGKKKKKTDVKKKRKKNGQAAKEKDAFISQLDRLFDICVCHCSIQSCEESGCSVMGCKARAHSQCKCPAGSKIPPMELEFMRDQRTKVGERGRMQIGGKDGPESVRQEKASAREKKAEEARDREREKEQVREETRQERTETEQEGMDTEPLMEDWGSDEMEDETFERPGGAGAGRTSDTGKWSGAQNREHFPRTVMAGMRGGVSTRVLANILSSYAVDRGFATEEDPRLLVDHRKVGREQEIQMKRLTKNAEEWLRSSGIDSVQFDGKDEVAKAWVTLDCGAKVVRHVKEDHITLTDAEGEFLMHFTREKVDGVKAAKVVAIRILTFLRTFGIDATLRLIGADSTNVNTGCKEGTIVILERLLGRRLVWSICLLHTNELPLRHLIEQLDGPTGSGNSFTGPAGQLLSKTQSLPYNPNFIQLSVGEALTELRPEVVADLSWDQLHGYKMLKSLQEGSVPRSLQIMVIGPVDHARWLTTANRCGNDCLTPITTYAKVPRPLDAGARSDGGCFREPPDNLRVHRCGLLQAVVLHQALPPAGRRPEAHAQAGTFTADIARFTAL
jgi:hypothetical protein